MHLLIAAAGSGRRMGADRNKLLLPLLDRPVLAWTIDSALAAQSIEWIGIVGQPRDKTEIMNLTKGALKSVTWINGGKTRQESVQNGLAALPVSAKNVLIHDGARCLIEPSLFNKCSELLTEGGAIIAATPVTDTIKKVSNEGIVLDTPQRSDLWAAQTPQAFSVTDLKKGHAQARKSNWVVTDDASLFERLGWPVKVLESPSSNIKVTTPVDLVIAKAVIDMRTV